MRYLPVLLLAAGCASPTPSEMRKDAPKVSFETGLAPLQAAQCLARAAEDYPQLSPAARFHGTWREGPPAGRYEVLVRRTQSVPLLVADVVPSIGGSSVKLWHGSFLAGDGDLGTVMAKACAPRDLKVRDDFR